MKNTYLEVFFSQNIRRKHTTIKRINITLYQTNYVDNTGTSGAGTAYPSRAPEFTPILKSGSCFSIFSFTCMFCRSLFVLLHFFFWPLCCLFFFDIRILITPLVSSNSSFYFVQISWYYPKTRHSVDICLVLGTLMLYL